MVVVKLDGLKLLWGGGVKSNPLLAVLAEEKVGTETGTQKASVPASESQGH